MNPVKTTLSLEKRCKKLNFLDLPHTRGGSDFNDQHADALWICEYAKAVHGIHIPEDFSLTLLDAHRTFFQTSSFYMNLPHVDAIVASCETWKKFIANQEFDSLVCKELESFARIHTSVIQALKIESVQAIRLEKQPDFRFTTIVNKHGYLVSTI